MNENEMAELNSGQIMTSMRMSSGGGLRGWATCTPGTTPGNGGWSPVTYLNPDPICQGTVIRHSSTLDGAPRNRLLFSNPNSSSSRANQTVRMSEDEGQTWIVSRQIDTAAGYSCLTVLPDGTMGLFYEDTSSGYQSLIFARFDMDWLTRDDADSNGDGMSDYYKMINGLNLGLPSDANLDTDGDGVSNLQEYLAGTMANDPNSFLHLTSTSFTSTNLAVSWASIVGRRYAVMSSPQLSPAVWTPVAGAEGIIATGYTTTFSLPLDVETNRYFRIMVLSSH